MTALFAQVRRPATPRHWRAGATLALGLSAGAVGWSGLAQAASEETSMQMLLLPEHYELMENGVVVFKLETGENLSLTADQYLILDDGLLLITDELAQASVYSLPVMGSVRAQLLSDLAPVATIDGTVAEATPAQTQSITEGQAPRLSEQVDLQSYEVAQSSDNSSNEVGDALATSMSAAPGAMALLGMLMTSDQPASAPSYSSYSIRFDGIDENDYSGWKVSGAGDVDNDGLSDLLISGTWADPGGLNKAGETYLIFGSAFALGTDEPHSSLTLGLDQLNGANGIKFIGIDADDESAYALSSGGDMDGDGFDDILIGAHAADGAKGEAYIVFGSYINALKDAQTSSVNLGVLDGERGLVVFDSGAADDDVLTLDDSLSSAGDVDGDGLDDLLIAAPDAMGGDGEAYVVFGSHIKALKQSSTKDLDLAALDGDTGILIESAEAGSMTGRAVERAGDVDGDGLADIIIGAPYADLADNNGAAYLVFGSHLEQLKLASTDTFDLSGINGTNGIAIVGAPDDSYAGWHVSTAGDVDGDGLSDLLIGAPYAGSPDEAGETYLVFGSHLNSMKQSGSGSLDLSALDGTSGMLIRGVEEDSKSGWTAEAAGDIDLDGLDDIFISVPYSGPMGRSDAGSVEVIFGSFLTHAKNSGTAAFDIGASANPNRGVVIYGTTEDFETGEDTAWVGDFDGDGKPDLLLGAEDANPGGVSNAGSSYLVSGHTIDLAADGIGVATAGVIDLATDLGHG